MPLHQRVNIDQQTQILIWRIEEPLEQLKKDLKLAKADEIRFQKRKILSHQKEFLASRRLLLEAGIPLHFLIHDPNGIPRLESGQQLSITHTRSFAGIAIGTKPLGFDIEIFRPKIQRIARRFIHPQETFLQKGDKVIEKLTLLWTAKEALYKVLKKRGIIFSQQIQVTPFQWGDKEGSAKVFFKEKSLDFSLNFIVGKSYCSTLATPKNKNYKI